MYKPKSNLLKELYLKGYIHQCTSIEKLDYIAQKKKIVCHWRKQKEKTISPKLAPS